MNQATFLIRNNVRLLVDLFVTFIVFRIDQLYLFLELLLLCMLIEIL